MSGYTWGIYSKYRYRKRCRSLKYWGEDERELFKMVKACAWEDRKLILCSLKKELKTKDDLMGKSSYEGFRFTGQNKEENSCVRPLLVHSQPKRLRLWHCCCFCCYNSIGERGFKCSMVGVRYTLSSQDKSFLYKRQPNINIFSNIN